MAVFLLGFDVGWFIGIFLAWLAVLVSSTLLLLLSFYLATLIFQTKKSGLAWKVKVSAVAAFPVSLFWNAAGYMFAIALAVGPHGGDTQVLAFPLVTCLVLLITSIILVFSIFTGPKLSVRGWRRWGIGVTTAVLFSTISMVLVAVAGYSSLYISRIKADNYNNPEAVAVTEQFGLPVSATMKFTNFGSDPEAHYHPEMPDGANVTLRCMPNYIMHFTADDSPAELQQSLVAGLRQSGFSEIYTAAEIGGSTRVSGKGEDIFAAYSFSTKESFSEELQNSGLIMIWHNDWEIAAELVTEEWNLKPVEH